jgi:hypothetical protein
VGGAITSDLIKMDSRIELTRLPARASEIGPARDTDALAAKRHHLEREWDAFKFVIGIEGGGYFGDAANFDQFAGLKIQPPFERQRLDRDQAVVVGHR